MKNEDIASALKRLFPTANWVLSGDDLSGLLWLDNFYARPTDKEIIDEINTPPIIKLSLEDRVTVLELKINKIPTVDVGP